MANSFNLTQQFHASIESVLAAREKRYDDISKQDGLKGQELLDKKTEGGFIISRRALSLADRIPDAVKTMIPAGLLNVTEEARFEIATNTNRFEVTYDKNPDKLRISGITRYIRESENSCKREYNISVRVDIPLIGGMVETQIMNSFRKGIERDYEIISELLNK